MRCAPVMRFRRSRCDDCLELRACIRSNVAHAILSGEVLETMVCGQTSDISGISFRTRRHLFPDDKVVLGRYLGPSIVLGHAMTAKPFESEWTYSPPQGVSSIEK